MEIRLMATLTVLKFETDSAVKELHEVQDLSKQQLVNLA